MTHLIYDKYYPFSLIRGATDINNIINLILDYILTDDDYNISNEIDNNFKFLIYAVNKCNNFLNNIKIKYTGLLSILEILIFNKMYESDKGLIDNFKYLIEITDINTIMNLFLVEIKSVLNEDTKGIIKNFIFLLFIENFLNIRIDNIIFKSESKFVKICNKSFIDFINFINEEETPIFYRIMKPYKKCSYLRYVWIKVSLYRNISSWVIS
jgi:hypothetical protein